MADAMQLPEPLKQIVDVNLGYYRALGRVTADYVKALGQVWTEAASSLGVVPGVTPDPRRSHAPTAPRPTPALLLEAESGQSAQAVFMVNNELARTVSATVMTSDFASADGRSLQPSLRVQPGSITLEPGGRTLVQLTALVDDALVPGLSYRGEVSVPGLSDAPIPVVLRRKPSAPAAAGSPVAGAQAHAASSAAGVDAAGDRE